MLGYGQGAHLAQQATVLVPTIDAVDSITEGSKIQSSAMLQSERIFNNALGKDVGTCCNYTLKFGVWLYLAKGETQAVLLA